MLDRALDDLVLTPEEAVSLNLLAEIAGITDSSRHLIHKQYLADVAAAALRDEVVTGDELRHLESISLALGLNLADVVPHAVVLDREPVVAEDVIVAGMNICFTGVAVDGDQQLLERGYLTSIAERCGFLVCKNLTKRDTQLLVAADPNTTSGKAGKARKWNIPVVSVQEFLQFVSETHQRL